MHFNTVFNAFSKGLPLIPERSQENCYEDWLNLNFQVWLILKTKTDYVFTKPKLKEVVSDS